MPFPASATGGQEEPLTSLSTATSCQAATCETNGLQVCSKVQVSKLPKWWGFSITLKHVFKVALTSKMTISTLHNYISIVSFEF